MDDDFLLVFKIVTAGRNKIIWDSYTIEGNSRYVHPSKIPTFDSAFYSVELSERGIKYLH